MNKLKTLKRSSHQEKGAILLLSLILLLILTLLGMSAMDLTRSEMQVVKTTKDYNLAFQAAETAINQATRSFSGISLTTLTFTDISHIKRYVFGWDDTDSRIIQRCDPVDNVPDRTIVNMLTITLNARVVAHAIITTRLTEEDSIGNRHLIIESIGRSGAIGGTDYAEAKLVQTMKVD